MKKNIILFYITRALFLPFFWLPVLTYYLMIVKGFSPATTTFLLSIQEFLLIFLEVPTGVVADKISRRLSVAIGYILSSLPFVFLPFTDSLWIIVAIFATKALGKAFISGADTSLLYDLLSDNNQQDQYKKIINKSKSYMMAVVAVCIVLGGFISKYNIDLTLILPFPLMLIGAISVLMMDEPETSKKAKEIQQANYITHTWQAFKQVVSNRELLIVAIILAIVDATGVNMKWYYTPLLTEVNFDLAAIGGITAALYVMKSILAGISTKFMSENNIRTTMISSFVTFLALLLPVFFLNGISVVVALTIVILFTETMNAASEEHIHGLVGSHNRSTTMSMISIFSSILATLTLNLFGILQEKFDIKMSLVMLSVTFLIAVVLSRSVKKEKPVLNAE